MSAQAIITGHFGEWLQGRMGLDGRLSLITVNCPALSVRVKRRDDPILTLVQEGRPVLSRKRARALLDHMNLPISGCFTIDHDMPAGGGAGASTGALLGVLAAAGCDAPPADLARSCVAIEGASDPIMFPHPDEMLWASRRAEIVQQIGAIPECEIVGGFLPYTERTEPEDLQFPDISDLVPEWERAIACGDLPALADLASISAERTTTLRGPEKDITPVLRKSLGALGHIRAHTGSARGLVFERGTVPPDAVDLLRAGGLTRVIRFTTGRAP